MTAKQRVSETSPRAASQREAVRRVKDADGFAIDLPLLGRVKMPRPEQLAFYGALGLLAAVEIIEWPVALVLATGHALMHDEHSRIAQEVGEALEDA
jgi:hypothetical protein